ncbi:AraC family transcriptional regulator [Lachnospiraceae bacterium]|nr:AraC family transcriptional regulator [Lachnospiraceae bacterium]
MNILEYENAQEIKFHGHGDFPFNIYLCSIPLDFSLVPAHWHNDTEIIYVKKGKGRITVELFPFEVSQGDIIVVLPGQLHSIQQISDYSMEYENIIFQLSMLMGTPDDVCTKEFFQPLMLGKVTFPNYYPAKSPQYPVLAGCLDAMDEICRDFSSGYQLAVKGQLFSFFYGLARSEKVPLRPQNHKSLERLKVILKHVEHRYQEKISIADAAKICGFSKSHFMKFFKQNMNISFTDYLNTYRLTIAARLLTSSEDTVSRIAAEIGFDNLSYFNRIFKEKYQCTPTQFRRQT